MIICSNCQSKQLDGTMFCVECGASLLAAPARTAAPRRISLPSVATAPRPAPASIPVTAPMSNAPSFALLLPSGRRIELALSEDALIGRKDTAHGIVPDVDLGGEGGYDAGVSRRHAIVSYRNGVYQVEDLGSSNGTFVNGKRLVPETTVAISSGDELTCGTLRLRVFVG